MEPTNEDPKLRIEQIPPSTEDKNPEVFSMVTLSEMIATEADRRLQLKNAGKNFGPVTPFPKLTEQYGGSIPKGLHIILGQSGVGKTAFALQIGCHCECPCLYISCEMAPVELAIRITARETQTPLKRFKNATMSLDEIQQRTDHAEITCEDILIVDGTVNPVFPDWIKRVVSYRQKSDSHFLIVIDSLHSWAESIGGERSEYESITAACQCLRQLAATLQIPIIALGEQNRASTGNNAPKDTISSGAGSRKIEYGSESVLSLKRDPDRDSPTGDQAITVTFAKNRNGSAGKEIHYTFQGGYQRYIEQ